MIFMKKVIYIILGILLISACKKDKLDKFSVVYEVEFVGKWSAASHPTDFPVDAQFAPFVAHSHLADSYVFFDGLNASDGLIDYVETGQTNAYQDELQLFINSGQALDKIEGVAFSSPGNSNKVLLGMKEGYHYATVVCKISPSPDWFVATRTSLLDQTDGLWYDEVVSQVVAYDAGADLGLSFSSPNLPNDTLQAVRFIDAGPLTEGQDTVIGMGYVKFTRIK